MSQEPAVRLDVHAGVARLTFNRPQVLNAIDARLRCKRDCRSLQRWMHLQSPSCMARSPVLASAWRSRRILPSRPTTRSSILPTRRLQQVSTEAHRGRWRASLACANRMELALLAESVCAAEALRLHLVNHVVARAELESEANAWIYRLAQGPTRAYGQIRSLLRGAWDHSHDAQLESERAAFHTCARTRDFKEGIDAFLSRRAPSFEGC